MRKHKYVVEQFSDRDHKFQRVTSENVDETLEWFDNAVWYHDDTMGNHKMKLYGGPFSKWVYKLLAYGQRTK